MTHRDRANALLEDLGRRSKLPVDFPGAWLASAIEQALADALFEERQPKTIDMGGKSLGFERSGRDLVAKDAFGATLLRVTNLPEIEQDEELRTALVLARAERDEKDAQIRALEDELAKRPPAPAEDARP